MTRESLGLHSLLLLLCIGQMGRKARWIFHLSLRTGASSATETHAAFGEQVLRSYSDFFSFHCKLLDLFPEDAEREPREIPYLPGKKMLSLKKARAVAMERVQPIMECVPFVILCYLRADLECSNGLWLDL